MQSAGNDNAAATRRRFARRANDICVLSVGENTYPVHDWSQCGVLFEADGRHFEEGATISATMKFKSNDVVTDIPLTAKVIRTARNRVAFEFENITNAIESAFSSVINSAETKIFA